MSNLCIVLLHSLSIKWQSQYNSQDKIEFSHNLNLNPPQQLISISLAFDSMLFLYRINKSVLVNYVKK